MRKLSPEKRIQIISALVEGCSIRSTVRMTGVSKNTVTKLLVDMGRVCQQWHDENVRGLNTDRVQCDEIWAFVGAKQKQVERGAAGVGDVWTWTSIDADTKLAICWLVGERDSGHAFDFMHDLAGRLTSRVQLTTDGLEAYVGAVVDNFGPYVDYAQLIKLYGDDPRLKSKSPSARYSPGRCVGTKPYARVGSPDPKHINTSYVERQNLTMRMSMRRFTRLTNAFSKKVENHEAAIALHFAHYNLCRIHSSIRVTPAMEAGVTTTPWSIEDLVGLLEADEKAAIEAGAMKRGPYGPRNSE
ncbi:MAG: IS1 family transposase [Phycisphaeraceae bacterium]